MDDEPDIRTYVRRVLGGNGHIVEESVNPSNVLELLERNKFNVVLLDVRMPGMSGIEFYKIVIGRWPKMASQVIFISGDNNDSGIREFVTSNKFPYISKPFDQATLKIRVNAILGQKQDDDDDKIVSQYS